MPKQYEALRDKFNSEGMDLKDAKTKAAKIYNSSHTDSVSNHSDKSVSKEHVKKHKKAKKKVEEKKAPFFTA